MNDLDNSRTDVDRRAEELDEVGGVRRYDDADATTVGEYPERDDNVPETIGVYDRPERATPNWLLILILIVLAVIAGYLLVEFVF